MKTITTKIKLSRDTEISTFKRNFSLYALHALDGQLFITDYDNYDKVYGVIAMELVVNPVS